MLIASLLATLAHATPPHDEVGIGPALAFAPFREQQVSARRNGGGTGGALLSLDRRGVRRYDRLLVSFTMGRDDGWRWGGGDLRFTIAPDVAELGPMVLRVGGEAEVGAMVRTWLDNVGWRGQATLGPAMALAWPFHEGASRWTAELVASTPVFGLIGRPGYAAALQTGSLSTQDFSFATFNRHRGGRLLASLLWEREGRASVRFQAELGGRVITWRHRLAEVNHVLSTLLYWRL
ncbi:MAG: hypothetical protein AAGA48_00585 [Myxococcota bacterium]